MLLKEHPEKNSWSRHWSPMVASFSEAMVNSLFDPAKNQWNSELLSQLFSPYKLELIKGIPLGQGGLEDKLIWPHVCSGAFQ